MTIRYVGNGELTAAVAVLKNGLYPVTAESIQKTKVIGWNHTTMTTLMHRYPQIAINLLGIVLSRIDDVRQRYLEICTEQVDRERLIAQSMLSPATCCLINPDKERTVERTFAAVNRMADVLKTKYR